MAEECTTDWSDVIETTYNVVLNLPGAFDGTLAATLDIRDKYEVKIV